MATPLENAVARRDAILTELAALSSSKPDYSIDGESVSHAQNRAALMQELKDLQAVIQQLSGPFIKRRRGRP